MNYKKCAKLGICIRGLNSKLGINEVSKMKNNLIDLQVRFDEG